MRIATTLLGLAVSLPAASAGATTTFALARVSGLAVAIARQPSAPPGDTFRYDGQSAGVDHVNPATGVTFTYMASALSALSGQRAQATTTSRLTLSANGGVFTQVASVRNDRLPGSPWLDSSASSYVWQYGQPGNPNGVKFTVDTPSVLKMRGQLAVVGSFLGTVRFTTFEAFGGLRSFSFNNPGAGQFSLNLLPNVEYQLYMTPDLDAIKVDAANASASYRTRMTFSISPQAGAVPEPATWLMLFAGFAGVGLAARRRQHVRA